MMDLVLHGLDAETEERLRATARASGRSVEEEARLLLAESLRSRDACGEALDTNSSPSRVQERLGTSIASRFAGKGFTDEEFAAFETALKTLRGPIRAAPFE